MVDRRQRCVRAQLCCDEHSVTAGGSAVGSDAIYQEVVKVQQAGKPVVVSMGNLAASGGYYISGQLLSFITHHLVQPVS